jgi:hypothetical protein
MQLRRLIASGLLLTVLLAPVLGMALCVSPGTMVKAHCEHCAMKAQPTGWSAGLGRGPASAPEAPCCERKKAGPALREAAQIVAPVQIALMAAVSPVAMLPIAPTTRVEMMATPPLLTSVLSLLCTLLI